MLGLLVLVLPAKPEVAGGKVLGLQQPLLVY